MGVADVVLLMLIALADCALLAHLHLRRQRRVRIERMMRSLRGALQREAGAAAAMAQAPRLVLQQAG